MRKQLRGAAIASFAAILVPFEGTAVAQSTPNVMSVPATGQAFDGTLSAADPVTNGFHYHQYSLHLKQGQSVLIKMHSDAFDSRLSVLRADDPTNKELTSNDDYSDGTLDSRLRFTPPSEGDYLIRAAGPEADSGPFRVLVNNVSSREPVPKVLPSAGQVQGELTSNSAVDQNGAIYDLYRFTGEKGQRVLFEMSSLQPALKPALTLQSASSDFTQPDDGDAHADTARLVAVLPNSGSYKLFATATDGDGRYSLRVTQRSPRPATEALIPFPLANGANLGRFDFDDADLGVEVGRSGALSYFYKLFSLQVTAGEQVKISVSPEDGAKHSFVIDAGARTPLGFARAVGTLPLARNTPLALNPISGGEVVVRVRSLGRQLGKFSIVVARGAAAAQVPASTTP
jgi:hypothetical protein